MKTAPWFIIVLILLFVSAFSKPKITESKAVATRSYKLGKGIISRPVLENYLSRSITLAEFCTSPDFIYDGGYDHKEDDIRLIKNTGAKFIGRSIYAWGREQNFINPRFLQEPKQLISQLHKWDKDLLFQACIFEIITEQVNKVPVPAWVFAEFNLPVEQRNFNYSAMLNTQGIHVNLWQKGSSVPDVTQLETRMWFFYLAKNYIDIGIEALHFGQVELIGMADWRTGFKSWQDIITRVRTYAKKHARRKMVLCDAHLPHGGVVIEGKLLFDFHSFPLRPKELPQEPQKAILEQNYLDSFYGKSKGGITPSGWKCENLPYLAEFDNFGIGKNPGQADTLSHYVWGYDEITWFSLQPENYRNQWLEYAWHWVRKTDPNGFVQMPGSRVISLGKGSGGKRYRVNTKTAACPNGFNQEETIKKIWAAD